jgi:hypothetical protein
MTMAKSRGRRGALSVAAGLAAAAAAVALAVPAMAAREPNAGAVVLAAGQTGTRASVPWSRIGPGWALTEYSAGSGGEGIPVKTGADTLYLVDPAGGRYTVASWPRNSAPTQWQLQAWSGDAQRALFIGPGIGLREEVHQLDLRTGRFSSFLLPAEAAFVDYTRPDGLNIVVLRGVEASLTSKLTFLRLNLRGQLQKTLASVEYPGALAYQPGGQAMAVGWLRGLELVSNQGGVIRSVTVPGVTQGCNAVRWWSASVVLASCAGQNVMPRMWLVPVNGSRTQPLTPARHDGFDLGDFDAWQLSSGLYVNGYGACGTRVIGRQPAHGAETEVNVPGSSSSLIVTATSTRLMVERINGCQAGNSLVWFNPASRALTVAVPDHDHQFGVIAAIPYFVTGKF